MAQIEGLPSPTLEAIPSSSSTTSYVPSPEWKAHLFDCCLEPKIAFAACFCPCCVAGYTYHEFTDKQGGCGTTACYFCIGELSFALCGWGQFYSPVRFQYRRTFGIKRGGCDDILAHCFCHPFAVTQEYREVKLRRAEGYKYSEARYHFKRCECKRCTDPPPPLQTM